jgi:GNAT superfamily N-acetyltransferase
MPPDEYEGSVLAKHARIAINAKLDAPAFMWKREADEAATEGTVRELLGLAWGWHPEEFQRLTIAVAGDGPTLGAIEAEMIGLKRLDLPPRDDAHPKIAEAYETAAAAASKAPSTLASSGGELQPPLPELHIRTANVADKPAMLRVMAPFKNRFFPGGLQSSRTRVAELGDEVVGFIGWEKDRVLALYVAEAWRGRGSVGLELLSVAESAIRKAGHKRVRIMIDADATKAHRFYRKHDYVTDWDRENEDIAWMIKDLA